MFAHFFKYVLYKVLGKVKFLIHIFHGRNNSASRCFACTCRPAIQNTQYFNKNIICIDLTKCYSNTIYAHLRSCSVKGITLSVIFLVTTNSHVHEDDYGNRLRKITVFCITYKIGAVQQVKQIIYSHAPATVTIQRLVSIILLLIKLL